MKKIVVFASGNGSNAENLIRFFNKKSTHKIVLIASNNTNAKVLIRARKHQVPIFTFNKLELDNGTVLNELKNRKVNFIVLAGFLLKIPFDLINNYKGNIINIHPSLLPLYGGKGMYGLKVHQKVFEDKAKETGITIHFVNEKYDDGLIIFQARCLLKANTTIKTIEKKVRNLELKFFPIIIERLLNGKN